MSQLTRLRELIEDVTELENKLTRVQSEENLQEIRKRHPDSSLYPSMFGELSAHASAAASTAKYALEVVESMRPQFDLLERLQAVLENFDVMANPECSRELRLLEILCEKDDYKYERRKFSKAFTDTLNSVECQEWEAERDDAIDALMQIGFQESESDEYEGLIRWVGEDGSKALERVIINYKKDGRFEFSFGINDETVVTGTSGEFSKLLEAVGVQVPASA